MSGELGHLALMLAFVAALVQAAAGLATGAPPRLAGAAVRLHALALAGAFAALTAGFVQQDFTLVYVVQHSNALLPVLYRVAAVWGGHEGSMLLWALVLAGWSLAAGAYLARRDAALARATLGVLGLVSAAMAAFVLFTSNPFVRLLPAAQDGQDLNPMLQDPGLVLHPPLLYLGYVGTAVPFALVMARLLRPAADPAWVRWLRPFALWAFAFLTLGIALGSWWAYYELGWGGWWFWDPVENASLMPWLALGALLHALPGRGQRGVFALWTGVLALAAFALSLVGTFLVRSGVLTSVHAFASDPQRGVWMLAMVAATLLAGTAALGTHAARLAPARPPRPWALRSREAGLALSAALLAAACGSVLLGTLYPLAVDALGGGKLSVGPPYFDAVMAPITLPLAALAVLAPWLGWGDTAPRVLARRLAGAGGALVLSAVALPWALHAAYGSVKPAVVLALVVAAMLAVSTLQHLLPRWRGAAAATWGMALAHGGVAVFTVGVAMVNGYGLERDARLAPGERTPLGGCALSFDEVLPVQGPNYSALRGRFTLDCPGQAPRTLQPEKRAYPGSAMPMSESAIVPGLTRDLYLALGDHLADPAAGENSAAALRAPWMLRLQVKPFMRWVWAGTLLMAAGAAVSALSRRERRVPRPRAAPAGPALPLAGDPA